MSHTFAIQGDQFVLDGQPFQIRSGELHYNRIPRAYWRDRMLKAKAMGLNTICTYTFWNEHERESGQWRFDGNLDIRAFILLAKELDLWVLLRPGPYVCSEWEWGGLPYWLATIPNIQIRQNNAEFLERSAIYMRMIAKQTADLTIERGGPILMVQVENEYGSFDSDHEYMAAIRDQIRDVGFDGTLFTSDGPTPEMLAGGTLSDVPAVINFGSRPEERFAEFAKFRQDVPRMCGELWFGWFDHWGQEHHVTDTAQQAKDLEWFMETGASFNIYMLQGGTNWGFMNGANWTPDGYRADVSSYDYDSAIAEDGRLTRKFYAFREVIGNHCGEQPEPPEETPSIPLHTIGFAESCPLVALTTSSQPGWKSMEEMGQGYGYVLYRLNLNGSGSGVLALQNLQDYAIVMSDNNILGSLDRRLAQSEIEVEHNGVIEILVENTGRINYAREMLAERKGIQGATFNGQPIEEVTTHVIDLDRPKFQPGINQTIPALYRATFTVTELGDTHLDLRGWGKGNVWINGFNLGRHWKIGPQQTTYCPAPFLRKGENEIIISDLEPGRKRSTRGLLDSILGSE